MAKNTFTTSSMSPNNPSFFAKYLNKLTNKLASSFSNTKGEDSGMYSFLAKEYGFRGNELNKKVNVEELHGPVIINSEEGAVDLFRSVWDASLFELQEHLYALYLDIENRVVGCSLVSVGNTSIDNANPSGILLYAEELSASKVILAHNHPSGVNKPSSSDLEFTEILFNTFVEHEVELVAHFILTKNDYCSIELNKR